jgi:putative flippase GtrA
MIPVRKIAAQVITSSLWQYKLVRYAAFHVPVGLLNYSMAFSLYWVFGINMYLATTIGHGVHVYFGYFHDRDVTYRKPGVNPKDAKVRYWVIEIFSYSSIVVTYYVTHDVWGVNEFMARGVYAMIVATSICLLAHQFWSFGKEEESE